MPTAKINDINMYYEVRGSGEPIVLIVGLGSDITSYKPIIDWLAAKHKVLAFDNRGAGRTDKPDTAYTIDMMADDTAALMNKLNIPEANIVGISMGGRVALAMALNHPEYVKRLVLVCTSARRRTKLKISLPMRLMYPLQWLPIYKVRHRQPRYAFLQQRRATLDFDATNRLTEIKVPTLILHGKKDVTAPFKGAEELNAGIKGSKLIPFKGGHLFFVLRERQRFLDEIVYFVG